jgi:hypothetical protein
MYASAAGKAAEEKPKVPAVETQLSKSAAIMATTTAAFLFPKT